MPSPGGRSDRVRSHWALSIGGRHAQRRRVGFRSRIRREVCINSTFRTVTASCLAGERLTGCGGFISRICVGGTLANTCGVDEIDSDTTTCYEQAFIGSSVGSTTLMVSAICRF